jgi:hypothetical protein
LTIFDGATKVGAVKPVNGRAGTLISFGAVNLTGLSAA